MLPQITAPGISPVIPLVQVRTEQGAQPFAGETAASASRAETAERVDPPRTLPATARLPEERRREALYPPDPDAPTGPPPAFEASPLERARETALAAVTLLAGPGPRATPAPDDDGADGAPAIMRPGSLPDVLARATADVAEVRRMAEPEPDRTVDVTR